MVYSITFCCLQPPRNFQNYTSEGLPVCRETKDIFKETESYLKRKINAFTNNFVHYLLNFCFNVFLRSPFHIYVIAMGTGKVPWDCLGFKLRVTDVVQLKMISTKFDVWCLISLSLSMRTNTRHKEIREQTRLITLLKIKKKS